MRLERQTSINSYMILEVFSENSRNWSQSPFSKFRNLNRHTHTEAQVKLLLLINNMSREWSLNAFGVGLYNLSLDLCSPQAIPPDIADLWGYRAPWHSPAPGRMHTALHEGKLQNICHQSWLVRPSWAERCSVHRKGLQFWLLVRAQT